jgi:hypothetical protein
MKLKKNEVIDYVLNEFAFITGWQLHNKKKRPDLADYIEPPDQMTEEGLLDEYDRPCWLHRDGQIRKVDLGDPTPVEDAQKYFQELSRLDMIKLLIKGIENKNDSDYTDFVDKINLL